MIVTHRRLWAKAHIWKVMQAKAQVRGERPSFRFVIVPLSHTLSVLLKLVVGCVSLCRNVGWLFESDSLSVWTETSQFISMGVKFVLSYGCTS